MPFRNLKWIPLALGLPPVNLKLACRKLPQRIVTHPSQSVAQRPSDEDRRTHYNGLECTENPRFGVQGTVRAYKEVPDNRSASITIHLVGRVAAHTPPWL
jgi:hypothetical protein